MTETTTSAVPMTRETAAEKMSAAVKLFMQNSGYYFPDLEEDKLRVALLEAHNYYFRVVNFPPNGTITAISYDGGLFDLEGWTVIVESRSGFYLTRDLYAMLEPGVAAALLSPRESALLLVIDTIDTWQQGRFGERLAQHHRPEIFTRLMRGSPYAWFLLHSDRTLQIRIDLHKDLFPIEVQYRIPDQEDHGTDEVLSYDGSGALKAALGESLAVARG